MSVQITVCVILRRFAFVASNFNFIRIYIESLLWITHYDFILSSIVSWEANDINFDFIPTVHSPKLKTKAAREVTMVGHRLLHMTDMKN